MNKQTETTLNARLAKQCPLVSEPPLVTHLGDIPGLTELSCSLHLGIFLSKKNLNSFNSESLTCSESLKSITLRWEMETLEKHILGHSQSLQLFLTGEPRVESTKSNQLTHSEQSLTTFVFQLASAKRSMLLFVVIKVKMAG